MTAEAQLMQAGAADSYANPTKVCDLIMKGGITSGVIYPSAVCELAKVYRFKNLGGASAGAIAAATAAAAEYARLSGMHRAAGKSGFEELEDVPGWLARNLGHLFQPDEPTRPIFNVLLASLEESKGAFGKGASILHTAVLNFPSGALVGVTLLAPLLVVSALTVIYAPSNHWFLTLLGIVGVAYTLLLSTLSGTIGSAVQLLGKVVAALPSNFYGICSGCDPSAKNDPTPPLHRSETLPLTNWLADELDQLAGLDGRPLTFGDLWNATGNAPEGMRDVNLEMMTTNLTFGRPYRLPLETRRFFYKPSEFRRLFPKRIVDWMVSHTPTPKSANEEKRARQEKIWRLIREQQCLLPLPDPENLPVVVATRMSLSYPVLISAVPLYAVDWDRPENAEAKRKGEPPRFERCLFSDGGIGSNFPIHFFDQALPRWPTFGINLREISDEDAARIRAESAAAGVNAVDNFTKIVESNSDGLTEAWDRFDTSPSAGGRLLGFISSIINTMYNWADNTQINVPGYRDRIVHVYTTKSEGGLNLNMNEGVIAALSDRGRAAGARLLKRFMGLDGSPLSWDNHRWIRYRSTMSMIEKLLAELAYAYQNPMSGDRSYEELIRRKVDQPPPSYPWKPRRRRVFARHATEQLVEISVAWAASGEAFKEGNFIDGAPRPMPEIRIKPRV